MGSVTRINVPFTKAPKPEPAPKPKRVLKDYGKWDPQKDSLLRFLWQRTTIEKLIIALGMSQGAVYKRAHFLGLEVRPKRTRRRQMILARIE